MSDTRSTTGGFLALIASAMFGISGAVAAGIFDVLSPAHVAQVRALVAAALLVAWAGYRRTLNPQGGLVKFAILGMNLAAVNVTFYWAIERLGVGPGATVQFLAPVLVLLWIAVVRKQPIGPWAWVAAVGAVVGVGLVTQAWSIEASEVSGLVAGLASAVLFASYLVYGEFLGRSFQPSQIAAWGFVFAALIWAVAMPLWNFPVEAASTVIPELLIVGIAGTALPFIIEFAALRMTSSGIVGIIAASEPPIGAISAVILLDQTLEPSQWLGIAVVVLAVAVVQWRGLSDMQPATPIP